MEDRFMYRYTVPINNLTLFEDDREGVVNTLRAMKADRVMLCIGSYHFDPEEKKTELEILKDNCAFLKSRGIETGAWLWTFMDVRSDSEFVRMRTLSGGDSKQSVCPSDAGFRKFAADYLCDIARCGVDIILYDDDFRYGNLNGIACLCDNHLSYMSKELGEKVTLEQLHDKLFVGGANKYRSAWLRSKRYYFELFAKEMREALDKVAPNVRIGICSSHPNWDYDGITSFELGKLLAGNTRPFVRLCGAPYWAPKSMLGGHRLQDTIELSRMLLSYANKDDGIETVSEGDTYPRPRWSCPASYLEGFDMAIRASGGTDGILKYTFDYTSSSRYEKGYNNRHISNLPIYDKIDSLFGDKKAIGVRVFEYLNKYENMLVPPSAKSEKDLEFHFFSYASRMLAAANIPTSYDESDTVGIAFGENARYLTRDVLKNGIILDARAAEILSERGIDVGIKKKGERLGINFENFVSDNEKVALFSSFAYKLELEDGANIESTFTTSGSLTEMASKWANDTSSNQNEIVGSYTYENADGERFLVFSFDGGLAHNSLLRSYARADQLKRIIPYLGNSCGFYISTSPDLYAIAKRKGNKFSLGLWNFCADAVDEPTVYSEVSKNLKVISTIGCTAEADNGILKLSRIEPYGFAAVEYETC